MNHSKALMLLLAMAGICNHSEAVTRRHDRTPEQYADLANLPKYNASGMVLADTGGPWLSLGSGTLITPQWVLTAGHAIAGSVSFQLGSSSYTTEPSSYRYHPSADLGLFKLSAPVTGLNLPRLYNASAQGSEKGREGVMVGYGWSGTGLTGESEAPGTKYAGQNVATWFSSEWAWAREDLLVDFSAPGSGALDLEGGPAHGDSGGGFFIEHNSTLYIAGVQSYSWFADGSDNAAYGDGGGFLRVSDHSEWIKSVIPEPNSAGFLVLLFGFRRHRRR